MAEGELDVVPGEGEEQVEDLGFILVFHAAKKATLLLICPDKLALKETPDVNLVSF